MGDSGPSLPASLQRSLDNTKVDYVQLGKSGLKVSIPVLGAMSFGKYPCFLSEKGTGETECLSQRTLPFMINTVFSIWNHVPSL